jgi:hypothetical protein
MKKTLTTLSLLAVSLASPVLHAQSIDYGMTAATVQSPAGTPLPAGTGGFQLLYSSVFTPTSSSTLSEILGGMTVVTGSFTSIDLSYPAGQPYLSGIQDLSITTGTKLYALASTSSSFSPTAPWALLSGPSGNGWVSPNTGDPFAVSQIEFSLAGNQIVSAGSGGPGVGAYFQSAGNAVAPVGEDSNLILVPEPSTYALLSLAGMALGGYAVRRRRRA